MAMVTIPGGLWIPRPPQGNTTFGLTFYGTLSGATQKMALLCQAPKTGNVRKVVWGVRSISGGPGNVDVRVEGIDKTVTPAVPSGTLWGTNTNGTQSVATSNAIYATTLTADAAVTRGDQIAIVVVDTSGITIQSFTSLTGQGHNSGFPYIAYYNGSTWAVSANNWEPMISLEYSDGTYAPIAGVYPTASALNAPALSTSSTPDVSGLRFQLPWSVRAVGACAGINSSGDYKVKLVTTAYVQATDAGLLASATVDKDLRSDAIQVMYYLFDAAVTLSANTWYRLLWEPTSATTMALADLTLNSLAQMDAWEGGANFHFTNAKDPAADGDWTNYNSGTFRVPLACLLIDGVDTSAAGATESASVFA